MSKFDWEKELNKDDELDIKIKSPQKKKIDERHHTSKKKPKPFERKDKWSIIEDK